MSWSSLPEVQPLQRRWNADRHRALHQARDMLVYGHGHAHGHKGACGEVGDLM